jgi:hypothetical protein
MWGIFLRSSAVEKNIPLGDNARILEHNLWEPQHAPFAQLLWGQRQKGQWDANRPDSAICALHGGMGDGEINYISLYLPEFLEYLWGTCCVKSKEKTVRGNKALCSMGFFAG